MSQRTRWIYWLALGLMHVALAAAVVFLIGQIGSPPSQPARWPEFALVFAGALLPAASGDWGRRLAPALGLGLIALALKSILGGGLSPLAGWSAALDRDSFRAQEALLSGGALIFLFQRGLGVSRWSAVEVAAFLRRGIIGLLCGLIFLPFATRTNPNTAPLGPTITLYAALFVAGGLLAMALEHSSGYTSDDQQRPSVGRTLALVGGLVGLVVLLVSVFSSSGRTLLSHVLGAIVDVAAAVIGIIAGTIYALGVLLIPSIEGDLPPATPVPGTAVPSAAEQAGQLRQELERLPVAESPWFEALAQGAAILLVALLAWLVIRQALRRWRRLAELAGGAEERTSVWSWGQFGADVRHLLQGLLPDRAATDPGLSGAGAAARIRRAYRRLIELGAQANHPRRPDQTPAEYRAALDTASPASLEALTAAYEQARYGSGADDPMAEAAERALREIEASIGGR
jgi:hypothetical protein